MGHVVARLVVLHCMPVVLCCRPLVSAFWRCCSQVFGQTMLDTVVMLLDTVVMLLDTVVMLLDTVVYASEYSLVATFRLLSFGPSHR